MHTRLLGLLTGLTLAAAPLAAPLAAHADTSSDLAGESFATSASGWTTSATYGGLCLPELLCPAVTGEYAATGGAGTAPAVVDGYLRTRFSSLASTVAGTSVGTWDSPTFTYDGVAGEQPTSVALDLSMRSSISGLLGLDVLNDSSYRVDLVDQTGAAVAVVPNTPLAALSGWTATPTAQVSPGVLSIGRSYSLRITTTYHAVAAVIATGDVGYDDVRLTATKVAPGGTTVVVVNNSTSTTTNNTTPQPPVEPTVGIRSTRELRQLVRTVSFPTSAKLADGHVRIRFGCPAQAAPRFCKVAIQGLSAGKGSPASTGRQTLSIDPGKSKLVSLKLRPTYLARYAHAHKIVIRAKVRVGVYKVTVVKKVRLRHS